MATTLTAQIEVDFRSEIEDAGDLNTVTETLTVGAGGLPEFSFTLTDGTGVDEAQKQWYAKRTVTAGSNDDIDLRSLTGRYAGTTVSFDEVKWLIINIRSPGTGVRLVVGGAGTNEWSAWAAATGDKFNVEKFDLKVTTDGWAVDSTHKVLRVNNPTASSVTYDIVVIGN